eukprot:13754385-Alexandrium_andersonii.AAC.1
MQTCGSALPGPRWPDLPSPLLVRKSGRTSPKRPLAKGPLARLIGGAITLPILLPMRLPLATCKCAAMSIASLAF